MIARTSSFPHCPDILINSRYDPHTDEALPIEPHVGSHGGLGGPQTEAFILHPADWRLDEEIPLGAPAIYRNLRRWLSGIGIELGRPDRAVPSA